MKVNLLVLMDVYLEKMKQLLDAQVAYNEAKEKRDQIMKELNLMSALKK